MTRNQEDNTDVQKLGKAEGREKGFEEKHG